MFLDKEKRYSFQSSGLLDMFNAIKNDKLGNYHYDEIIKEFENYIIKDNYRRNYDSEEERSISGKLEYRINALEDMVYQFKIFADNLKERSIERLEKLNERLEKDQIEKSVDSESGEHANFLKLFPDKNATVMQIDAAKWSGTTDKTIRKYCFEVTKNKIPVNQNNDILIRGFVEWIYKHKPAWYSTFKKNYKER